MKLSDNSDTMVAKELERLGMMAGSDSSVFKDTVNTMQARILEENALLFLVENPDLAPDVVREAFLTSAAESVGADLEQFEKAVPNWEEELVEQLRNMPNGASTNQILSGFLRAKNGVVSTLNSSGSRGVGLLGEGLGVLSASGALYSGAMALQAEQNPELRNEIQLQMVKHGLDTAGGSALALSYLTKRMKGMNAAQLSRVAGKVSTGIGVLGNGMSAVTSALSAADAAERGDRSVLAVSALQSTVSFVGMGAGLTSLAGVAAATPVLGVTTVLAGGIWLGTEIHQSVERNKRLNYLQTKYDYHHNYPVDGRWAGLPERLEGS
jgi:hypothetical protein